MTTKTQDELIQGIAAIDASIAELRKKEDDINVQIQGFITARDAYKAQTYPIMIQLYNIFNAQVSASQEMLSSIQTAIANQETQKASLQAQIDALNAPKPTSSNLWIYIMIAIFILLIIGVAAFMLMRK